MINFHVLIKKIIAVLLRFFKKEEEFSVAVQGTSSTFWGPIPECVAKIRKFLRLDHGLSPLEFFNSIGAFGGICCLPLASRWPGSFRPRVGYADTSEVRHDIYRCAEWIEVKAVEVLKEICAPFISSFPHDLLVPSQSMLDWTFFIYLVETSTDVIVGKESQQDLLSCLDMIDKSSSSTAVDYFSRHILMERLIAYAFSRCSPKKIQTDGRNYFGMRKPDIVEMLLSLRSGQIQERSGLCGGWLSVIHCCVVFSPLTILCYFDILLLKDLPETGRNHLRNFCCPITQSGAWGDLITGPVTRSLVNAVFAPSPCHETLTALQHKIRRLKENLTSRNYGEKTAGKGELQKAEIESLERDVMELHNKSAEETADRLHVLSQLLDSAGGLLHCAFLVKMVNHVITVNQDRILREYCDEVNSYRFFRAYALLADRKFSCIKTMADVLFRLPVEQVSDVGNKQSVSESLRNILNFDEEQFNGAELNKFYSGDTVSHTWYQYSGLALCFPFKAELPKEKATPEEVLKEWFKFFGESFSDRSAVESRMVDV